MNLAWGLFCPIFCLHNHVTTVLPNSIQFYGLYVYWKMLTFSIIESEGVRKNNEIIQMLNPLQNRSSAFCFMVGNEYYIAQRLKPNSF